MAPVDDAGDVAGLMASCWRERVGFERRSIDHRRLSSRLPQGALSQNERHFFRPLSCPLVVVVCLPKLPVLISCIFQAAIRLATCSPPRVNILRYT